MARKIDAAGRRQTAFRCQEPMLGKFQGYLKTHGIDMSKLVEGWIGAFMAASDDVREELLRGASVPKPDTTKSGIAPSTVTDVLLHTTEGVLTLTPEEWRWVGRALYIHRSQVDAATRPLDTNLDAFVVLANLLGGDRGESGKRNPLSDERSITGTLEDLSRLQDETRRTLERIQAGIDALISAKTDARTGREGPRRRGGRTEHGG